jgi:hypothetical protein
MTSSQTLRMPHKHTRGAGATRFVPAQQPTAMDDSPPEDTLAQAISKAAYFRAEARGFEPGHEMEDWVEAERQVAGANETAGNAH